MVRRWFYVVEGQLTQGALPGLRMIRIAQAHQLEDPGEGQVEKREGRWPSVVVSDQSTKVLLIVPGGPFRHSQDRLPHELTAAM